LRAPITSGRLALLALGLVSPPAAINRQRSTIVARSADTEAIEEHIRHHVTVPTDLLSVERLQGAEELVDVIRTYLK